MSIRAVLQLERVLADNPLQPVIVVGSLSGKGEMSVVLPATVAERELHIPTAWHKELDFKAKEEKAYLVIEGLDGLSPERQEKFVSLIKDRRAGNYKLPANAQIVMPVAAEENVAPKIRMLSLLWEIK